MDVLPSPPNDDMLGKVVTWVVDEDSSSSSSQKRKKDTMVLEKVIDQHWFNHKLTIIQPSKEEGQGKKEEKKEDYFFYRVTLPPHLLLSADFLSSYVHSTCFTALSLSTPCDHSNTMAILPTKQLIITLDQDTHEQLGLPSKPCPLSTHHHNCCYLATIDLSEKNFHSETNTYKRVEWALKNRIEPITFLITAHKASSPCSIPISFPEGTLECTRLTPHETTTSLSSVPLPFLHPSLSPSSPSSLPAPPLSSYLLSLLSWVGMVACSSLFPNLLFSTPEEPVNDFLSTMTTEEDCFPSPPLPPTQYLPPITPIPATHPPGPPTSPLKITTHQGFFSSSFSSSLFQELRETVRRGDMGWGVIIGEGVEDGGVAWGGKHHSFAFSGENGFVCVVLPTKVVVFACASPKDVAFGK